MQNQVKDVLLLDGADRQGVPVFQLFARSMSAGQEECLPFRGFCLNILNGVTGLHLQGDDHASQSLHEDLHRNSEVQHLV